MSTLKHFIVEITYLASSEIIAQLVSEHRAFLQTGYDQGLLLMSGPQNPRTGGMIVARSESLEALREFFDGDPYYITQSASYRFVEFEPVKFQPWLQNWILSPSA